MDTCQLRAGVKRLREDNPDQSVSPGLLRQQGQSFEIKMQLPAAMLPDLEKWAHDRLQPDPHGQDGSYQVTTLYCDTPELDVYHRRQGYRRKKYRLRRYGEAYEIFLERKKRKGDRVRKKRMSVPEAEVAMLEEEVVPENWEGAWFHQQIRVARLQPVCRVSYTRQAFFGGTPQSPLRLTLDRELVVASHENWHVKKIASGSQNLLPERVLLEIKFLEALPPLFRELLAGLPPDSGRVSKYRLGMRSLGVVTEGS
ncbi:MAG: polyphosphate polymerase domain-containing protein [Gemmataceae bacterium]